MNLIRIIKRLIRVFAILLFSSSLSFSSPLNVGIAISGPPIADVISTVNGPHYFGYCIDVMNSICTRIGETCTYQETTLDNQFELLDSGKIDLLILAKPYSSDLQQQYATSIPYAVSKISFIVLKNGSINKLDDIKNKKIGALRNTFYDLLVQSSYHNQNQIIAYDLIGNLLSDLAQHEVDVIVLNNALAYRFITNDFSDIKRVGRDLPLGGGYGIIALPDKAALIQEINKAILEIEKDGTYTAIYEKYYIH